MRGVHHHFLVQHVCSVSLKDLSSCAGDAEDSAAPAAGESSSSPDLGVPKKVRGRPPSLKRGKVIRSTALVSRGDTPFGAGRLGFSVPGSHAKGQERNERRRRRMQGVQPLNPSVMLHRCEGIFLFLLSRIIFLVACLGSVDDLSGC
jgi:hypothetical protein